MNHRLGWVVALVVGAFASGCANDEVHFDAPEAGVEAAEPTAVSYCLDPKDPAVHYESDDPVTCQGVALHCRQGQYGFDNACGCGCVDKGELSCPAIGDERHIRWVGRSAETCGAELPSCQLGELPFKNGCGCGCIQH